MIKLKSILESAITSRIELQPIGHVTCKWDTGNTSRASALNAQHVEVVHDHVEFTCNGQRYNMPLQGWSKPRDKARRPIVKMKLLWRDNWYECDIALTDRNEYQGDLLVNLETMQRLGVRVDTVTGTVH